MSEISEATQDLGAKPHGHAGQPIIRRVNLSRVPPIAWRAILAQIAREEGIAVEDIVVEGCDPE
jgi:hypothetical protein